MLKLEKIGEMNKNLEDGIFWQRKQYVIGKYIVEVDYEDGRRTDIDVRQQCVGEEYVPEIIWRRRKLERGGEFSRFEIHAVGYGGLHIGEVRKMIKGYQDAVEVVEILTEQIL